MIKFNKGEVFKEIIFPKKRSLHYAISNHGRMISYADKMKDGNELFGADTKGYRVTRYKEIIRNKIYYRHLFYFRLVAEYFLKPKSENHTYVIHLDHNKSNDHAKNLKWATREEMLAHNRKSPAVIQAIKNLHEHNLKHTPNLKLSVAKVKAIKKALAKNVTLKALAQKYEVSDMQIHRIKTGENWSHVTI